MSAVVPLTSALLAGELRGQGLSTAAIQGVVIGADSAGIADAIVSVTNTSDGERWQTVSHARGRYAFEYLSVGGPYTVSVEAIGFQPASESGILLTLGQRRRLDFHLSPAAFELPPLAVTGRRDARLNAGRTGPAQTISDSVASNLPVPRRDFSQLTLLSPQGVLTRDSGVSFAGQSDRLNGFQIDGASNADLGGIRGLSGFGTPGSANRVRTLSVEAIKELQILIAPFDVRYGNFAGGLVNAVTRSGSNRWEGSISSYFQNQQLTGKDAAGNRAADFTAGELTITLAGPIVRNRAAFFLDAGLQHNVGTRDPTIGADTTGGRDSVGIGIRRATAERFQDILSNTYQVDPGSIEPAAPHNPAGNVFAKVTLWPALNHRIEVSHNYAQGTDQRLGGSVGPYQLSSQNLERPSTVNATRLNWTVTGAAGLANDLTFARLGSQERCLPVVSYPEIDVTVDSLGSMLAAGVPNSCAERFADQTVWELTDNLSWLTGTHHLTLGTHDELLHLSGSRRVRVPAGRWHFASLDSLEAGQADEFIHDFAQAGRPEGPVSDYDVHQLGLYAQDQWTPLPRLTLTGGLRFDVPFLPTAPDHNPALYSALGVNTATTPTGNIVWSPRLGFSYDVGGRGTAFLRGGAGLFSGRPIYLYFSNAFETTGLDWLRVDCQGTNVPAFTVDPDHQPTNCASNPGTVFEVNYFDPSFRFPRNLRLSLGTDVALPWDMVGTVDLLYIEGIDQFDITDVNLVPPTTASAGEGGRLLYGTIDPATGFATANRVSNNYGVVAEMRNSSGDRTYTATGQLQKRFRNGTAVSVAYTYTDAKDRMSANCFNVTCNLDITPLDGTLNDRRLSTSRFEARHKVTIAATANLPIGFRGGLFYNGYTGQPYTYLVLGDANADELGNDIVYVPKTAADITLSHPGQWAQLNKTIDGDPCLRSQRGTIMRRNSCQNHWETLLNGRLSRPISLGHGQSLEMILDVFNLPNLIDSDWGVHRVGTDFGDFPLLELKGYDQANQRGIYDVLPVQRNVIDEDATRWRMQLGARMMF
jgi:outer membrane receptor protein involved in Fe transport